MKKHRSARSALLILDMMNKFDFPEAHQLLPFAERAAARIAALKRKLTKRNWPVIYVNDHFGNWHSNWAEIYNICSAEDAPGKTIAEMLKPAVSDYFILKPKHSAFYLTSLELLLKELKINKLIITGIAGNLCVLFTAHDAHMREFEITVPKDCIASNSKTDNDLALRQISKCLKLSIISSNNI
jgi:nicotinamidase-related amidase